MDRYQFKFLYISKKTIRPCEQLFEKNLSWRFGGRLRVQGSLTYLMYNDSLHYGSVRIHEQNLL